MRVRRSVLYMPAANERALEKAKQLDCDAIIFDLEDAVAADLKDVARAQAVRAATSGDYGHRELTIRCNGLDTPWGEADVRAAAQAAPSAVVIPKVASAQHVQSISDLLDDAGAPPETNIWAMIETPAGMIAASDIAAHPRVELFVMGTNDMARELRAQLVPGRQPLLAHLAMALLAARRHAIFALDGVYNDVRDTGGFAAECQQGFEMGFDGKTLIHPSQIEPCNSTWSPSADDVDHAGRVIAAFHEAERDGRGVATVDRQMIENLHVEIARRTLGIVEAIASR